MTRFSPPANASSRSVNLAGTAPRLCVSSALPAVVSRLPHLSVCSIDKTLPTPTASASVCLAPAAPTLPSRLRVFA
ncbi:MAG: hypothetical protein LBR07_02045 [Puniceicoccales bacterium]|nr:hypothetical protein [Puniceicoccales bacterium]